MTHLPAMKTPIDILRMKLAPAFFRAFHEIDAVPLRLENEQTSLLALVPTHVYVHNMLPPSPLLCAPFSLSLVTPLVTFLHLWLTI